MQAEWEPDELIGGWTLVKGDWDLIATKAGVTRLGFAVMLKVLKIVGVGLDRVRRLLDRGQVPQEPLNRVQGDLSSPSKVHDSASDPGMTARCTRIEPPASVMDSRRSQHPPRWPGGPSDVMHVADKVLRTLDNEPKLGVTVLRGDQAALIADQRPVLDQVTKLKRRAFHKRSSSR